MKTFESLQIGEFFYLNYRNLLYKKINDNQAEIIYCGYTVHSLTGNIVNIENSRIVNQ
jgi:hypothetical protein